MILSEGADCMKYIITGRNIEVTEGLKSAIYEKIGKLERYFTPDATVYVKRSEGSSENRGYDPS